MAKTKLNGNKAYNTVVFDCDSTLAKIEGIDELARIKGKEEKVALLTQKTQNGGLPFNKALTERLNMAQPTKKDMDWLGRQYIKNIVPGAKKVIASLKKQEIKTYIVSSGYFNAIAIFAKHLGVPKKNVFAIDLKFNKKGNYIGFDEKNPLTKNNGKAKVLKSLKAGKTLFVGDGITDLEARNEVDLFVGFGGIVIRPIVKQKADIFIKTKSLLPVLKIALSKSRKSAIINN